MTWIRSWLRRPMLKIMFWRKTFETSSPKAFLKETLSLFKRFEKATQLTSLRFPQNQQAWSKIERTQRRRDICKGEADADVAVIHASKGACILSFSQRVYTTRVHTHFVPHWVGEKLHTRSMKMLLEVRLAEHIEYCRNLCVDDGCERSSISKQAHRNPDVCYWIQILPWEYVLPSFYLKETLQAHVLATCIYSKPYPVGF